MIASKDYERCLLGTMVEVHLTLIHYLIGRKGSTLVADLREMMVLQAPRGLPQSPTKRSLLAGSSMTPKKRRGVQWGHKVDGDAKSGPEPSTGQKGDESGPQSSEDIRSSSDVKLGHGVEWGCKVNGDTNRWGHKVKGTQSRWGHKVKGTQSQGDTKSMGWRHKVDGDTKSMGWGHKVDGDTKSMGWGHKVDGTQSQWGHKVNGDMKSMGTQGQGDTKSMGTQSRWGHKVDGDIKLGPQSSEDIRSSGDMESGHGVAWGCNVSTGSSNNALRCERCDSDRPPVESSPSWYCASEDAPTSA
ncbi:hypothetical protein JB92DRAFT_2825321 [Gautieria morchelliformis]|nr:hypothetical protein JB92DRAFT_2825321 [Gautieria morchelliformis]